MIVLFTDFGARGPYIGQLHAVLAQQAPGVPVVELFNDAPAFQSELAAYLLAAYVEEFPVGTVFLCVVDPGVGSRRKPIALHIDGRWYVGPDNGLFNVLAMRVRDLKHAEWLDITWKPERLSASFHGRDLFAPVAARLACGDTIVAEPAVFAERVQSGWANELKRIVYIDSYGNAMTGVRAAQLSSNAKLWIAGKPIQRVRTFSDVAFGESMCYENANGLLEIAVNQGSASQHFGLKVGDDVHIT
jgi:S-adenosylmethionine hydrolase